MFPMKWLLKWPLRYEVSDAGLACIWFSRKMETLAGGLYRVVIGPTGRENVRLGNTVGQEPDRHGRNLPMLCIG